MRMRADTHTAELFSAIPNPAPVAPGCMDYRKRIATLTADVLAECKKNRYIVAARMSELADHETSKALLDSYTAPSRDECNLPAWKIPLLEAACGSRAITEFLVTTHGGRVLWGAEVLDADIGQIDHQIEQLRAKKSALKDVRRRVR